jgi:2',3'-cyclic-nucleotide 2'-phosphodiesterase (5'-nucleotidase family)
MSAVITGLTNGTPYWVWVKAKDASGNESSASPSNNETPHPKPALNMNNINQTIGAIAQAFPNAESGKGDRLSRKQETALADLTADAMVYWIRKNKAAYSIAGTIDFAFVNGGVIQYPLAKGSVTIGTVKRTYYADAMSVLTMSGAQIRSLFEYVASIKHTGGGGSGTGAFGQVSKEVRYTINYTYGSDQTRGDLENFTLNGVPLNPGQSYTFITSTYLVDGGDGYGAYLSTPLRKDTGKLISEAVANYIWDQDMIPLVPATDGRITLIGAYWGQATQ